MKGAAVRNRLRARRDQRKAQRAARRAAPPRRPAPPIEIDSPLEFGRRMIASGVRKSIAFDEAGNALEIDIDPDRFSAALEEIADEDEEGRGSGDLGLTGDDDNCPICRALRASQIGDARRAFSLDG